MNTKSTYTTEVLTETVEGRIKITKTSDGSIRGAIRIDNFSGDTKKEKPVVEQKIDALNQSTNYAPLNKNEDWMFLFLKIFKISNLIQYALFVGILSGIYGFAFQKGMVNEMGLDGFSVSYNIEDMYYFAFLNSLNRIEELTSDFYFSLIFSVFVFIVLSVFFILYFSSKYDKSKEKIKDKGKVKDKNGNKIKIPIAIISTLSISIISFYMQYHFKILLFIFGFLIFAPGIYGYDSGREYMVEIKSKPLCGTDEDEKKCIKITKNGIALTGEMVLETNDAFFIRKKGYFLYITKIGDNCAFSHYSKKDEKSTFTLDPDIQSLCFKKPDVAKATNS